ncbi:MAG TPA: hypothetical protein VMH89_13190 [Candidatus Acidoferrum sp.]|nr:hypothetical protein [Candidatus Acidoferrum sp.]
MGLTPNANFQEPHANQLSPNMPHNLSRISLQKIAAYVLVSVFLLIPCFWHHHIEAGDLGSHVYNAWLAQLIHEGKAPGLYLVWKWDNVLFDLLLFNTAKAFGYLAAEKISVSLCVLVFFWGVFAFLRSVAGGNAPWFLAPVIAMLAYSYIFHLGFMNYYLSLGLAAIGLALVWPMQRNGLLAAAILSPFILFAHPIGFLWFLATSAYRLLWLRFPGRAKLILPVFGIIFLIAIRIYIKHHGYEVEWRDTPFYLFNGADQFHVFGPRYQWFTRAILLFVLVATLSSAFAGASRAQFWKDRRLILELYLLCFAATALLPENLHTDPTGGWIGALVTRLTLISGILGLCWLATLPKQNWVFAYTAIVATVFFAFLYQDTALLNRMEINTRKITEQLPFGTRTLSSVFAPSDFRTTYIHIPDRACVGHCFLVSNYEPSTRQFRVRVQQGSPVVASTVDDSEDMQSGTYDVQDEDLPLKQIYQCDSRDLTKICIRDLAADEKNGRLGYHPVFNPFFSQNP